MLRAAFLLLLLGGLALPLAARAENVTIDVAVETADLDPSVTSLGVACMVCTADCEQATSKQVLGSGNASQPVLAHAYQGTISVTVPTSSTKGTDYLCRMSVSDGNASYVAGTGPDWTLPDDTQPFTNMLKGKLPSSKTPVATKCKNGAEPVNGKCPSSNVASTPGKTCPDGRPMPANGNCGVVGPTLDLPGLFQIFTPCPNGQARQPNGQCPTGTNTTTTTTSNSNNKRASNALAACPDGQARLKTGQCPGPANIQRNDLFRLFQPAPEAPR
jgi:hypothetical protein